MASHSLGCHPLLFLLLLLLLLVSFLCNPADADRLQKLGNAVVTPDNAGLCDSAVSPQGYKCQEFEVVTLDGYILSMQRIPAGRGGGATGGGRGSRQPVLLQHGILMDGLTWLLNSPEQSLAFVLADSGYDVWIANTRGTRWSSRHVSLNTSNPAYWGWSWDELVSYDLPATVDFVYNQTGQKPHYVGHSLGTLIALAALSQGQLVDKLKSAALLSPIAYLTHMRTPLAIVAAKAFVGEIVKWLGIAEFNPKGSPTSMVAKFLKTICSIKGVDCYDFMTSFTGINCCLNSSTVELFLKYEPQPTSTKTLIHLAQTFRDGVLRKYNYESRGGNIQHYGASSPPVYNLSSIPSHFPLFLSYGGRDSLSDVNDVLRLLDELKLHDVSKLAVQFVNDYGHADFIMAVTARKIIYDTIINDFFHYLLDY